MKSLKVILLIAILVVNAILFTIPQKVEANYPVKKPGWWIGDYCNCPILWMSDCDCIYTPKPK